MRPDDTHTRDQYAWHLRELDRIRAAFTAGQVDAAGKRRQIAAENARYYGPGDRLAVAREMTAPAFGTVRLVPVDPGPWAAKIRQTLGWPGKRSEVLP